MVSRTFFFSSLLGRSERVGMSEGWDAGTEGHGSAQVALQDFSAEVKLDPITDESALQYKSVADVTLLLRSTYLRTMFQRLSEFESADREKNCLLPEDPEYEYVSGCSSLVCRLEAEKTRVMVFLRAHYGVRFPDLAMFIHDSVLYAKVVKIIQNTVDLTEVVDKLEDLIPSQMLVVIISCASTTRGRELTSSELRTVLEACEELENLELAKQTFLEYIQCSMPLICPNLCAFLDTGITSQLFAISGSIGVLAGMDVSDLMSLGSNRYNSGGIRLHTTGFLSNSDLVSNLPAPLRPKALRLVANSVLNLARIDSNRRAANKDEGVQERKRCFTRIMQWLDPPVVRGAGNILYERRSRKRSFANRS